LSRAVLFDWDGTLADTRQVVVETFQQVARKIGVEASAEFIERRIGTGAERTFKEILQDAGKTFDDKLVKKLLDEKIKTEISLSRNVKLFPGALDLLKALQGKTRVALGSMNNRPVIEELLDSLQIKGFFEVVVTVEDVNKFKPDPEIFLKCAAKLGEKPGNCVVVEDSIFGVQAAGAAGMGCIAVLTGVYSRAELETANPGLIVESLTEKDKILKFIFR
jgi:HAD superfamily hydrolase (TIGR01509 family)